MRGTFLTGFLFLFLNVWFTLTGFTGVSFCLFIRTSDDTTPKSIKAKSRKANCHFHLENPLIEKQVISNFEVMDLKE